MAYCKNNSLIIENILYELVSAFFKTIFYKKADIYFVYGPFAFKSVTLHTIQSTILEDFIMKA